MSTPNDTDQKLERLLHGALRGTPDRPAPVDLEARVLAAIARGAALPWWRRSFAHWPAAARFGFVGLCAALTGLSILAIGRSPLAAPKTVERGGNLISPASIRSCICQRHNPGKLLPV